MPSNDYRDSGLEFAPDFVFGTATASYQIEGAWDEDGRGPSIWDTFSHAPGNVLDGDTGDVADDHYHRVDNDLDLIASLNLDAYRFSIAWPRIQPTGTGEVNQPGIDFYNRVIDGLIARGITPVATLYHWDLPQALEDAGGWTNRDTAYAYADYVRICGAAFGDRVAIWGTLNEPWCSAFLGYGAGVHAPGHTSHLEALTAAHHLNLAHGLGVTALRETITNPAAQISVTLNLHQYDPEGPDGAEAVRQLDAVGNRIFTHPMLKGVYPDDLITDTEHITDWAFVHPGDLELIHQPIDYLGINYYFPTHVKRSENPPAELSTGGNPAPGADRLEVVPQPGPYTTYGWHIDPSGLERLLVSVSEQFPDQTLLVTENGAAFVDEVVEEDGVKRVHDVERVDYLNRHLTAVHRAIGRGVNVKGYFAWSLMDNFEWNEGYKDRFGLVRVDYETLERIPKDSALWFAGVAKTRSTP